MIDLDDEDLGCVSGGAHAPGPGTYKEWDNRVVDRTLQYKNNKYDGSWSDFFKGAEWKHGVVPMENSSHGLPVYNSENFARDTLEGWGLNNYVGMGWEAFQEAYPKK